MFALFSIHIHIQPALGFFCNFFYLEWGFYEAFRFPMHEIVRGGVMWRTWSVWSVFVCIYVAVACEADIASINSMYLLRTEHRLRIQPTSSNDHKSKASQHRKVPVALGSEFAPDIHIAVHEDQATTPPPTVDG